MPNTLTKVFEGTEIRIVQKDGDPWLVANDVVEALEIAKTDSAVRRLDEDEKGTHSVRTPGGPQEMTVINEAGAYRLIFTSRKDAAVRFKRWLAHDVLPEIRRTGSFSSNDQADDLAKYDDDPIIAMRKKQIQIEERLDQVEERQEARKKLDGAREPEVDIPEKTVRDEIGQVVVAHAMEQGGEPENYKRAWQKLYSEFRRREHISLPRRAHNRDMDKLDVAEDMGVLEELYAVAFALYGGRS